MISLRFAGTRPECEKYTVMVFRYGKQEKKIRKKKEKEKRYHHNYVALMVNASELSIILMKKLSHAFN